MANYIVVNYLFKVVRRHWLSFHHYLDPLDRLSKTSSKTRADKRSEKMITKKKKNRNKKNIIVPSNNITTKTRKSFGKWDLTFLYPILHMTFCSLFGNVYLVYAAKKEESSNNGKAFEFEWSLETLFASPYMLFHQVFPRLMWHQSDVCDMIGIVGAIAIYCSFLRNAVPQGVKYRFVEGKANTILSNGRSELSEPDSAAILAYHRRLHPPAMACLAFFILATLGFSYLNVFYVHRLFRPIPRDLFLWVLVYPLHVCYVLYAIFALIHFPIMASKFLQIRQKSQLDQLTALAQQLTTTCITFRSFDQNSSSTEIPPSTPPPPASFYSRKQQQLEQIWRQTVLLNRAYAVLCADIATASRFWSPFLSIFLLEHITLQAYMAYIVFIIRTLPFTQKLFFLYALIEVEALLFLLINRCAQIVKLNQKVERVNAQVYLKLFTRNLDNGRRENKVVHRVILKAEWLQMKDRLKPYCMVLMDNYRITSKTFYMVISYIAVFFLMVFKNQ